MVVQSIQELFLIIISFQFYSMLWSILVSTGLIAVPFLVIFWDSWLNQYKKNGGSIAIASRRRMTIEVIVAFSVMILFYTPFVKIGINQFKVVAPSSEVKQNQQSKKEETFQKDIKELIVGTHIKVPILFSFFYSLSNGIMHAGVEGVNGLKREVQDLREFEGLLYSASIEDPALYAEVRRFTNECFMPAKSKYSRLYEQSMSVDVPSFITNILEKNPSDMNWIGSKVFLSTQGLYAKCENANSCGDGSHGFQAVHPVKQFTYNPNRDAIFRDNQGHPYCNEWWIGGTDNLDTGLRSRLIEYIRETRKCHGTNSQGRDFDGGSCTAEDWFSAMKDHVGSIMAKMKIFGVDEIGREAEDAALRHFLRNTLDSVSAPAALLDSEKGVTNSLRNILGMFGSGKKLLEAKTTMQVVKQALPIIQALLIMILIIMLPVYGLVSCFALDKAMVPIIALCFIKMLTVWWAFISFVDNKVLDLMGVGGVWSAAFQPISTGTQQSTTIFLWNSIVAVLYLAVPLLIGLMLQKANDVASMIGDIGSSGMSKSGGSTAEGSGKQASQVQDQVISNAASSKSKTNVKI
ncbi:conjugal transfer protein TraG N-terminal domain-containing protein [Pseudoalteromonas maricaloris]|uniref:Conjugal transfer protein TraG n=1 Tax=Pseudoalteromonas maricaloris TaxID=184924 RepID=A0A8I2H4N6_9GAMM|nr:conjugal transfer protein TraG N-terminal domain-containing protein [Pseudoalteromonas maricaloris]NLR22983.1 conjugal transfer protein TraG [Pseudoalteromonas maricaloris]WOX27888.1 conjugal transfer protein TraG N-terminal domain-containing protein [Pseudoalteromonas maricaloris]